MKKYQVPFFESLVWIDLGLNPGLPDWSSNLFTPILQSSTLATMSRIFHPITNNLIFSYTMTKKVNSSMYLILPRSEMDLLLVNIIVGNDLLLSWQNNCIKTIPFHIPRTDICLKKPKRWFILFNYISIMNLFLLISIWDNFLSVFQNYCYCQDRLMILPTFEIQRTEDIWYERITRTQSWIYACLVYPRELSVKLIIVHGQF